MGQAPSGAAFELGQRGDRLVLTEHPVHRRNRRRMVASSTAGARWMLRVQSASALADDHGELAGRPVLADRLQDRPVPRPERRPTWVSRTNRGQQPPGVQSYSRAGARSSRRVSGPSRLAHASISRPAGRRAGERQLTGGPPIGGFGLEPEISRSGHLQCW